MDLYLWDCLGRVKLVLLQNFIGLIASEIDDWFYLPYFFDYKMGVFSFQNNPKDLDPSCKMDLDLWDCLGMGKTGIIARFHRTDLVIWSHSRGTKPPSYSRINTVCQNYHKPSLYLPLCVVCTLTILSIRTHNFQQTVQTQIRLLQMEQSDQGLHCLPFHHILHLLYANTALQKQKDACCCYCLLSKVNIYGHVWTIHVINFKEASGRFFFHFLEVFEKCIEYIWIVFIHFREISKFW